MSTADLLKSLCEIPESEDGCWVWTGATVGEGYGVIGRFGERIYSHRLSYETFVGPIPEGHYVDHMCHNKGCINPQHLRPATPKQNLEHLRSRKDWTATGVRGVTYDRSRGLYVAKVKHNYIEHFGGRFETVEEAEQAAINLRMELFTHNLIDRELESV
jgi:hypothetical protein